MRLIKKINNNFALAIDGNNQEVIVAGKGIGFMKMPCTIDDMAKISRSYYNVDSKYANLIKEIPEEIMDIAQAASVVIHHEIKTGINPNIVFTLADHLNFCVERMKKNMVFNMSLYYDIEQQYPDEMKIASHIVAMMHEKKLLIAESEATGIAMSIINSEITQNEQSCTNDYSELIEQITSIVEAKTQNNIDRSSFNYSRFVTHLNYLFKRVNTNRAISSENKKMFKVLSLEYPKVYECVEAIKQYLLEKKDWSLDEEEELYLILHINRVCTREDCNREGITPSV